jgi:hypothetical protein
MSEGKQEYGSDYEGPTGTEAEATPASEPAPQDAKVPLVVEVYGAGKPRMVVIRARIIHP